MTRHDQIIELLHLRTELTAGNVQGIRGDGNSVALLPHDHTCQIHRTAPARCTCWIESLTVLTRSLVELRRHERQLWYHVHERYIAADRRPRLVQVKNRHPQLERNQALIGLLSTHDLSRNGNGTARVLIETWSTHANPALAHQGINWLDTHTQALLQLPTDQLAA